MKRILIAAVIATPIVAAVAGVLIARATSANAVVNATPCGAPTVMIDLADGAALVTGGPASQAACDGGSCTVVGPEQVEVQADGRSQCVEVENGMTLALTRRDGELSFQMERTGR